MDDTQRNAEQFNADERVAELEVEIQAWKTAFGTSQLTHALAKLEAATKEIERLTSRIQDAVDVMCDGDNIKPEELVKDMVEYLQKTLDGDASAEGDD